MTFIVYIVARHMNPTRIETSSHLHMSIYLAPADHANHSLSDKGCAGLLRYEGAATGAAPVAAPPGLAGLTAAGHRGSAAAALIDSSDIKPCSHLAPGSAFNDISGMNLCKSGSRLWAFDVEDGVLRT